MEAVEVLTPEVGTRPACAAIGDSPGQCVPPSGEKESPPPEPLENVPLLPVP